MWGLKLKIYFLFVSCLLLFFSCKNHSTLFKQVSSDHSGIHFNNKIVENDSLNPIDVTNIYNGGGVGVGDFNNDGLQDIYFTGNKVSNKLYLNKGDLKFDDITSTAGVSGEGRWCRGVSVVDINNDGWQDIYVCVSMDKDPQKRENLLYINQGVDKNGVPHFKEMAAEYGLNDTTHSTMAAFFDYDNDGDLDMYLVVNQILKTDNPSTFRPKITDGSHPSTGRLYKNEWDPKLKHPVFKNVSKEAGITIEGYGHSVNIVDINKDGWKDIYVTNDFNSNDILYINNHDGTFTDKASSYFKHTSANGMGQDMMDINNDGLVDLIELDMNPQDNFRKKMMLGATSYQTYQNNDYFKYQYQYVRNTLQLNQGPRVNQNDSIGDPVFSDVGFFAGIAETDWSWTPLVQDFDNDGWRDIVITNGYPKDITDHDFIAFRQQSFSVATKDYVLSQIPEVKIHNYAFHNNGNVTFKNVTEDWGLTTPSFSNGAAYVDLDNDGDLDVVINNINEEAFVYENTSSGKNENSNNYLNIHLKGDSLNLDGLGAWIEIYYEKNKQVYEVSPYRGYLSSIQKDCHFGLGNVKTLDSLVVKWPNGKKQLIKNLQANQLLTISINNSNDSYSWNQPLKAANTLFTNITDSVGVHFIHQQKDFVDFNIQKLLTHKFSEYGPALASGDLNGDHLDDIIVGGNYQHPATILFQQSNGKFIEKRLSKLLPGQLTTYDMGISLLDVDGDGDLDIYISSGGYENAENSQAYTDHLYLNDGKGNFKLSDNSLPVNLTSKSCVRVCDFNKDGKPDLFIAGRVDPWKYPLPVSSVLYRNDSKDGVIKFTDVTSNVAPGLKNIGMVCDAIWTDFDNDGWEDLILTGEWMPVKFFKNDHGNFKDISLSSGVNNKLGWWTSIVSGDFDNDGKTDYILGNLGLNSFYRASDNYPVRIYAKDFDNNGSFDAIPTLYLPASQTDSTKKEFPAHTKDDMTKQMIMFRSKFINYKSYAEASFDKMFTKDDLKGALKLEANYFSNSYMKNMGNGKFEITPLPSKTQFSCMNGMLVEDFDGDGNLDLLVNGNDYSTEVSVGRYDGCNGLYLKGDGKGGFSSVPILQSGWFLPGNGKALVKLGNSKGKCLIAASENRGPLRIFKSNQSQNILYLNPDEIKAEALLKNGSKRKYEIGYGSSFLSQSSRFINLDDNIKSIDIISSKGSVRRVNL
ncbi:MAG: VCBS repeat-containing protein [Ginsengibacter sp.]